MTKKDQLKYRLAPQIAEDLLNNEGGAAHLYALEKVQTSTVPELWRQVLTELDKLTKDEGDSNEIS
jgi:hypothetical protein